MYGGTTREDPEYPGTLSIPDTVSVRWYVWGDNSGGSRGHCVCEVVLIPSILSIPDTVCEVVCMGGQLGILMYGGDNSGGSRVYLVFRTLCL